jgi:cytochrome c
MERDMFDTMTMTKVLGGFCGAFLVFLLGGWAAETIYHSEGGHGDHASGYVIEVETADAGPVEAGPTFAEVFATADAGAGERVFRKCSACHKLEDGANGTGPHLWDIVDREVADVDGFAYSGSLAAVAQVWDAETLNAFLEAPKAYAPGTAMNFNGLSKVEDRANLIAYLQTFGG